MARSINRRTLFTAAFAAALGASALGVFGLQAAPPSQQAAIATTQLFSRASVPITDGQLVTVPASGGVAIPSQFTKALILTIGLSDADKLAVGKTLQLSGFLSTDGGVTFNFVNGFSWTSYGPNGLTVTDPDGTVHVNPDPRLFMPLNGQTGLRAQLTYTATGLSTAAVTVFGVN